MTQVMTFSNDKLQVAYGPSATERPFNLPASIHYEKGQVLAEIEGTPGKLKAYTAAKLANPTAAPVPTEGGAGAFAAGTYYVSYTNITAEGETLPVTPVAVTVGASKKISIAAIALPTGATGRNWYISEIAGSGDLGFAVARVDGDAFDLNALPGANAADPPTENTAFTATDGTEVAKAILPFEVSTDSDGNIFYGAQASSEWGGSGKTICCYVGGCFLKTSELVGLDERAVEALGRIVSGDIEDGILKMM